MSKNSKFCIFCGEKPDSKTKEHVIPKWLIKLTGDINREISLGVDFKKTKELKELKLRKLAFSSFQFPACNICNNEFSNLEGETKRIIEKILKRNFIENNEINTLLDWFDKVRIGLWLGYIILDKEFWSIEPSFHIKKRICEKDRCLFVYELDDDRKGIQFIGTNSPSFQISPNCFALCINNYYFYNCSTDFLFSKNIGFPYPIKSYYRREDNRIETNIGIGSSKVHLPLLKGVFLRPCIEIYQPIFGSKLIEKDSEKASVYDNEYVKKSCLDYNKGIGHIYFKENNRLNVLREEEELCLTIKDIVYSRDKFEKKIARQVLENQIKLVKSKMASTSNLSIQSQRNIKEQFKNTETLQDIFMKLIDN